NQRWLEVFQLGQTELISRSKYEVFPSLHPGWRNVYERALAGQVVRSDRDTVDHAGQPVLYRWEVRPWRHADTSVGGVMITCLCIAGMRSRDASDGAPPATAASVSSESLDGLWSLPIPVLALDSGGRVCRAGTVATELFLAAGLREGETQFWQLFAGLSAGRELRAPTMNALQSVFSGAQTSVMIELPLAAGLGSDLPPAHWQLTKIAAGTAGLTQDCVLAIGLDVPIRQLPDPAGREKVGADTLGKLQSALKEAEDAVEVSRVRELRLRSVLDSIPCGLLLLDERGRVVFHNERADVHFGPPAVEGQPMEAWLEQSCRDEQHKTEVVRQWRESVWRKQLTRTVSLIADDGLLRDVELRPASLPGSGMLVMVHDVTSDRRSEELLRATEAKFRTIVHENPLPIVLTDRSGLVFEANAAAEVMLGRTRAELRRMPLEEWFTPDSHNARGAALRDLAQRGDFSANVSVELRHRDGAVLPASMRIASVPDAQGLSAATVHFFRPVEKSEAGASIFTPLDDAPAEPPPVPVVPPGKLLLSTDSHGRVVQWSEAAAQCFGLTHDEAMGRGLHTFFRPSDASGFYAGLAPLNEGGESQPVEWNFFHPEHGRMRAKFVLIPQEPGTLSVALMSENTSPVERKNITIRIAPKPMTGSPVSLQSAPASVERERMLLGETHHRVKNHLQIITSMLNLQLSTLNHDDAREALRSSQNRVRSIAALHQHLYALAMGEAGGFAEFASGLIAHLRDCYEVGQDRVRVELFSPQQTVPEEWLMPLALSLNEMVSNAFKHAYTGGRGGLLKIELLIDNGNGDLTVQDDGVGLPADFDDHRSGGLGLKIMRVFAGQLGGDVRVTSDPGRGASFHLHFPLVPVEG
ncbi:MAG: PAS domain S-box protein, partial [Verrucomicrobia bacterium]|nr:PAS domain S-box protein [Verrucomicrobiota bacterium]